MSTPKQPGVSVRLRIERDAGTDTPRYSTRARGGAVFTAERVPQSGWTPIRRTMSDDAGQLRMSSGGVVLSDDDGVIGDALTENEGRFLSTTEAVLTILSEAGRVAGLPERSLLRGRVKDAHVEIGRNGFQRARTVRVEFTDALAPFYDRDILQARFLRTDYPDIHRDLENTYIPVVIGEHSDAGAEDVNGNSAEKGLVPALYVGGRRNVMDDPTTGTPSYLAAPALSYVINGTPGTRTLYYGVTSRSAVGESLLSDILVVDDAPDVLDATNNVEITITPVAGATSQVVYGRRNPTPVRRLSVLAGNATTYVDTGIDGEHPPGPPATNTAQVAAVADDFFWDFYIYALGYVPLIRLFGSNVQEGVAPARIDITETVGVDYIEFHGVIGGNEVSGFYARGPRSQHHIDGVVTFAVQTCGVEDVGDGSGDSLQEAFPILQFILNEYVFKNGGEGYRSGLYGPLEAFADGAPMLQTSRFAACQALTQTWLGTAAGYKAAVYLRAPLTVRQFIQEFCQTFEFFIASNRHGQAYPVLYNHEAELDAGRLYRERIEVLRLENPALDKEHVEPRIFYRFDWDPDAQRFRSEIIRAWDQDAFEAQKLNLRDRGVRLLRYTRDAATAGNAMDRRVARLKRPRWKQTFVVRYAPGLEDEPGDQIRLVHRDGPGSVGWNEHPFVLEDHVVHPNIGEVALTGYNVLPLLAAGAET